MEKPTKDEIRRATELLHKKYGRPVAFYIELMTENAFTVHEAIAEQCLKACRGAQKLARAA